MPHPVVLFDLDGTVVDSIELIVRSYNYAYAAHPSIESAPNRQDILDGIGRPLAAQFRQHSDDEPTIRSLVEAYREYQMQHHDDLIAHYDGIAEVLQWLHTEERRVAVVTSKIEHLARRALGKLGLEQHFEFVVGLESTSNHKPLPDPLLFALDRLGASPSDAIYVGDSPFDIMAANAATVASIGVTWGASTRATLMPHAPTHIVDTAVELRSALIH
jgi:pyrophosphatase PpaX